MPNYQPPQPRGRGVRAAAALAVLALLAVGCGSDQNEGDDQGSSKQPAAAPDKPTPDDGKAHQPDDQKTPSKDDAGDDGHGAGGAGGAGAADKADPEQVHEDGTSSFTPTGGDVDSLSLDDVTCQGASAKTLFVSASGEGSGKSAQLVVSVQKGKAAGATLTVGKDESGGKTWQADDGLDSAITVETTSGADRLVVDDLTLTEFSSDEEMTLSGDLDCA